MQSKEDHNVIIARLFSDENIFQSLNEICRKHEVKTAIILSAIGQIKKFNMGYFDGKKYLSKSYEKMHELLSVSGMISSGISENDYKFHLHAVVGDEDGNAVGGHLSGGVVEVTNEIVMLKSDIKVHRKKDELTGLIGLYLE